METLPAVAGRPWTGRVFGNVEVQDAPTIMLMTLAASVQGPTARINPTSRSLSCMSRTVARAVSEFENFKCCRDTIRLLTRTDGQKRKLRTSDCFPESRRSGKPPERRTIRA